MLHEITNELYTEIIPILEKVPVESRDVCENIVLEVKEKIDKCKVSYDLCACYQGKLKDTLEEMIESEDGEIAYFADRVIWLIRKAPYFFTDD